MDGTPPGSIAGNSDSRWTRWTDGELFLRWLNHFQHWTHSSSTNPQLIILDGVSHTSIFPPFSTPGSTTFMCWLCSPTHRTRCSPLIEPSSSLWRPATTSQQITTYVQAEAKPSRCMKLELSSAKRSTERQRQTKRSRASKWPFFLAISDFQWQ